MRGESGQRVVHSWTVHLVLAMAMSGVQHPMSQGGGHGCPQWFAALKHYTANLVGYSLITTIAGPRRSVLGGRSRRPYLLDCCALNSPTDSVLVVITRNVAYLYPLLP
jgi:hypothetical protein